ncbi:MAG: metal ABC transporter permease, partial [Clostridia bacterium]|nr:metal ABC transporter permease [Clostridia bacterium]
KGDTAIGMISSAAMAVGVILYHLNGGMTADACNSLFGSASVVTLSPKDSIISLVLAVLVIGLFILFYHRIFAITFDGTFAMACTGGVKGFSLLLSLLTSVTVVVGMKMMGAVMISALIIFPAVSAMRVCKSFRGVVITAALLAMGCYLVGFTAACLWGLPTGPCVVVVNLLTFSICSFWEKGVKHKQGS